MPPKKQETQITQSEGKIVLPNGDIYEGEYVTEGGAKYRNGKGRYVCFCAASKTDPALTDEQRAVEPPLRSYQDIVYFEGYWLKDVFQEGEIRFADGARYRGKFDGTKYQNGGEYTFPDGTKYVGEFRDGQIHGKGRVNDGDIAIYRNGMGPGIPLAK